MNIFLGDVKIELNLEQCHKLVNEGKKIYYKDSYPKETFDSDNDLINRFIYFGLLSRLEKETKKRNITERITDLSNKKYV